MADFDGVWAIVKVGGGQYIGRLHSSNANHEEVTRDDVLQEIKDEGVVFMCPAFEYNMLMNQTPKGLQRMPLAVPVSVCMDDVGVWLWPTSIVFFADMKEKDVFSHKSVVEAAEKDILKSRAAASGLSLGGPMPPMPAMSGGFRGPGPGKFG